MKVGRTALVATVALLLFGGLWQCACVLVGQGKIPGLGDLMNEAFGTLSYNPLLASHPELAEPGLGIHVVASLRRASISVFGGFAIGMILTIVARSMKFVGLALVGVLDLQRVMPPLMFVPLTVFWFAPGEMSIIFAATAYSAATFALFFLDALRQADARFTELMAVVGETRYRRYTSVLLLASLPTLQGGFRLCSAITIGIVLVIEYFIGQVGLGKVLQIALYGYDVRLLLAAVIWSIIFVLAFDLVALGFVWLFRPDMRRVNAQA